MGILQKGILFLCTGNSCRSQMAEGFAKKMLSNDLKIFSAGLEPKSVHHIAVKVMQEVGIDISQQRSKNISEIPIDKIDLVVTLCGDAAERCPIFPLVVTLCGDAAERCPIFPGKMTRNHWEIEDPAKAQGSEEEIAKVFRKVRDKIKSFIKNEKWFNSLED
jgi:arsenate reductase